MYRRLRLLAPIVAVVLLIVGLTAGAIILSVNHTKEAKTDQKGNSGTQESGTKEQETGGETQDGSEEEPVSGEEPGTSGEEPAGFEGFLSRVRTGYAGNAAYFTAANGDLDAIAEELAGFDRAALQEDNRDMYDILSDRLTIEQEGKQYQSTASAVTGRRFCEVAGGQDYYGYLLRYLSGTDYTVEEVHELLADELNGQYASSSARRAADPSLAQSAAGVTKTAADTAYQFSTVTASSDDLLAAIALPGLTNGWAEFGLIRAYQTDDTLTEDMKNYMIESTRTTYAAYGLVDVSVHFGGWEQEQVTELFNTYFGNGQESFAQTVYQSVLENPGRYAAASLGYLELIDLEASLAANTSDYTEQTLFDFLFGRGPASFRVYHSWLGDTVS